MIALSVAPTLTDAGLRPRHLDLRPFAITGRETWVLPGGLSRVALKEGSLIVNSIYLPQELIQNNILGGFKFAFLSSIFAGYLGLLLYGVYQQYEQTRATIDLEVTQLTQLDRMAVVLSTGPFWMRDTPLPLSIAYLDSIAGVTFPAGGMHAVPRALAGAAEKHGVVMRYGTEVTGIEMKGPPSLARIAYTHTVVLKSEF